MLASVQDVMEAPGSSATELPPSTNNPQDEAQVLHEQLTEDAPVLFRVTSCPRLRYAAIQSDWLCAVSACAFAFAFTVASALALPLPVSLPVPVPVPVPVAFANRHRLPNTIYCLQVLPIPFAFGLLPLLVAGAFCPVGRQLARVVAIFMSMQLQP